MVVTWAGTLAVPKVLQKVEKKENKKDATRVARLEAQLGSQTELKTAESTVGRKERLMDLPMAGRMVTRTVQRWVVMKVRPKDTPSVVLMVAQMVVWSVGLTDGEMVVKWVDC